MSSKNLSTVATDVINTYGITATHIINSTRFGGERVLGHVDQRSAAAVERGTSVFNKRIRSDVADGRERVGNMGVQALHLSTSGAQIAVGVAVDLATRGVNLMAAGAERLERAVNLNALPLLSRVAMPAALLASQLAERIEAGSSKLVQRAAGNGVPAKAVATRTLDASTRKAAAVRKQVRRTIDAQVAQPVTRGVSKAVAKTATRTSNAARRVARKAKATAAAA